MTYLVADDLPSAPAGERFRALLSRPGILQMPGAQNGMAWMADQIIAKGMIPGLWIAPFLVSKTSAMAAQHPDWFAAPSALGAPFAVVELRSIGPIMEIELEGDGGAVIQAEMGRARARTLGLRVGEQVFLRLHNPTTFGGDGAN